MIYLGNNQANFLFLGNIRIYSVYLNGDFYLKTPRYLFTSSNQGENDWRQIACNKSQFLALTDNGDIYGQGALFRELVEPPLTGIYDYSSATLIESIGNIAKIACGCQASGSSHICIITNNGEIYSYHNNSNGQLAIGNTSDQAQFAITSKMNGYSWIDVACGSWHTAAINNNGDLYTAGSNALGQLGGYTGQQTSWYYAGSAFTQVACGGWHTAAINNNGELYTCGYNDRGQLGLGNTIDENLLTKAGTASNWRQVAAGYWHTAAINNNGELYTCGYNDRGQLGLGNTIDKNLLTKVGTASNWRQVAAGHHNTAAINDNNELYIWGDWSNDGTSGTDVFSPVFTDSKCVAVAVNDNILATIRI